MTVAGLSAAQVATSVAIGVVSNLATSAVESVASAIANAENPGNVGQSGNPMGDTSGYGGGW
jgi:hypothetical protein